MSDAEATCLGSQARNLARHGESLTDFADTAALVENLDLVMSVDTSIAHLAGALGRPVWLMNRSGWACWRWQVDRSDSPWYPTLRLFRQRRAGDWEPVIEGTIRRELLAAGIARNDGTLSP